MSTESQTISSFAEAKHRLDAQSELARKGEFGPFASFIDSTFDEVEIAVKELLWDIGNDVQKRPYAYALAGILIGGVVGALFSSCSRTRS